MTPSERFVVLSCRKSIVVFEGCAEGFCPRYAQRHGWYDIAHWRMWNTLASGTCCRPDNPRLYPAGIIMYATLIVLDVAYSIPYRRELQLCIVVTSVVRPARLLAFLCLH